MAVSVLPQAGQTPLAAGIISLVEGVRLCVCVLRLGVGGWRDSFVTTGGGITVRIWLCMDCYCLGSWLEPALLRKDVWLALFKWSGEVLFSFWELS